MRPTVKAADLSAAFSCVRATKDFSSRRVFLVEETTLMKFPTRFPRFIIIALALALAFSARVVAADSRDLPNLRAQLLDAYKRGETDSDNHVKQLREEISALEYIAKAEDKATGAAAA